MKKICFLVCVIFIIGLAGCKSDTQMVDDAVVESGVVPGDFYLILDVTSYQYPEHNLYMEINADGALKYARYDTGGTVEYDAEGMILVPGEEAMERGLFNLNPTQMKAVWLLIQDEELFELKDDYRMEIGDSYAFIAITGDGTTNVIDNIGMELPQAEALVSLINSFLPDVVWGAY